MHLFVFIVRIRTEGNFFTNKVVSTEWKRTFNSCTVVHNCNKKAGKMESLLTTKVVNWTVSIPLCTYDKFY